MDKTLNFSFKGHISFHRYIIVVHDNIDLMTLKVVTEPSNTLKEPQLRIRSEENL